jgi:hypothetical protein
MGKNDAEHSSLRLLDGLPQRDSELGFASFRNVIKSVAGAVAFGSFEEEPLLEAVREINEASFAVHIRPDFEIELMEAAESVGDMDLDFSGVDGLVIGVGDGEIGGAEA